MNILKINKKGVKICINILGIKITFPYTKKINYPIDKLLIETLKKQIKENTVLMLEANEFHGEIIPGYIKYLIDLGYNVDLLTIEKHAKDMPLCRFKSDKVQQYYTNISTIEQIIQNWEIMNTYTGFFVNTAGLWRNDRIYKAPTQLHTYFDNICIPQNGFYISVCHDSEHNAFTLPCAKNIALGATKKNLPIVNPCRFGDVKITDKNEKAIFLISGELRRNFLMVESAAEKIIDSGFDNFEIYITGRYKNVLNNHKLEKYIHFTGYLNFEELYSLAERADFILPVLDPDNKEHEWYINNGTSGCFQLSYGFCKPMIIAEKFAKKALVDSNSALIYNNNNDLHSAMIKAILLSQEEYSNIQNNLQYITQNLRNESEQNLMNILNIQRSDLCFK